ncbi:MAG: hypothetical protein FE834_05255, partial [Gammaproteobacteria bacterium]|nr:hypothetical protein [Gammaproteobacteria bacterium]
YHIKDITINGVTTPDTLSASNTIIKTTGVLLDTTWSGADNTNTRTLTYTVAAGQNGAVTINETALNAALVASITSATNIAFATTTIADIPVSVTVDGTAPSVVITHNATDIPKTGDTITYTFTFSNFSDSDIGANFNADDITVTNGTKGTWDNSDAANGIYTLIVTPAVGVAGNVSATVNANAVTDTKGNGNVATTKSVLVDTLAPTVAIDMNYVDLKQGDTTTVTFTFSENPVVKVLDTVVQTTGWEDWSATGKASDVVITGLDRILSGAYTFTSLNWPQQPAHTGVVKSSVLDNTWLIGGPFYISGIATPHTSYLVVTLRDKTGGGVEYDAYTLYQPNNRWDLVIGIATTTDFVGAGWDIKRGNGFSAQGLYANSFGLNDVTANDGIISNLSTSKTPEYFVNHPGEGGTKMYNATGNTVYTATFTANKDINNTTGTDITVNANWRNNAGDAATETTTTITADNTNPAATLTTSITANGASNTVKVQSTETGVAYLVLKSEATGIQTVAEIEALSDDQFNKVTLAANTPTDLSTRDLRAGNYVLITADRVGNLSPQTTEMVTIVDTTTPTISSASIDSNTNTLVLTLSEVVTDVGTPVAGDFAINSGASGSLVSNVVTDVVVAGNTITLTLTNAVTQNQQMTVAYTQNSDTDKQLKDTAFNVMPSKANITTTIADVTTPTLTISMDDTEITTGETTTVRFNFSEALGEEAIASVVQDTSIWTTLTTTGTADDKVVTGLNGMTYIDFLGQQNKPLNFGSMIKSEVLDNTWIVGGITNIYLYPLAGHKTVNAARYLVITLQDKVGGGVEYQAQTIVSDISDNVHGHVGEPVKTQARIESLATTKVFVGTDNGGAGWTKGNATYSANGLKISSFGIDDITTPNGTITDLTVDSNDASLYTATFTPTIGGSGTSTNKITVGTGWRDTANNAPATNTDSADYTVNTTGSADSTAPVLHATIQPAITSTGGGNSIGDTIILTLTFAENVKGLNLGNIAGIFRVESSEVDATWSGADNTNTRTLTYTIVKNQNGAVTIDETKLIDTLVKGITDTSNNAFVTATIANIDTNLTITPALMVASSDDSLLSNISISTDPDFGADAYKGIKVNFDAADSTKATFDITDSIASVPTASKIAYDATAKTVSYGGNIVGTVTLKSPPVFTQLEGGILSQANSNTLTKTSGGNSWSSGESFSSTAIQEGDSISAQAKSGSRLMFGLSPSEGGGANSNRYSEIDYAIYLSPTVVQIYENNAGKGTKLSSYTAEDVFSIKRVGDKIEYWVTYGQDGKDKDGSDISKGHSEKFYESATTIAATTDLFLETAFHQVNSSLTNITIDRKGDSDDAKGNMQITFNDNATETIVNAVANAVTVTHDGNISQILTVDAIDTKGNNSTLTKGTTGNDTIVGFSKNDTITGGTGNDTIT